MPTPLAQASAAELQRHLAELTGHTVAHVRPYGKHLLIQMQRDDAVDTVARLTEVARNKYTAARQRFAVTLAAGSRCRLQRPT